MDDKRAATGEFISRVADRRRPIARGGADVRQLAGEPLVGLTAVSEINDDNAGFHREKSLCVA
jgi:hypothetical protein